MELAKKGSSLQKQFDKKIKVTNQPSMHNLEKTFSTLSQPSREGSLTPVKQTASKDSLTSSKRRYKRSLAAVRTRTKSTSMEDLNNENFLSVLDDPEKLSVASSNSEYQIKTPGLSEEEDDDDSIIFGGSSVDIKSTVVSSNRNLGSAKSGSKLNGPRSSPDSENTSVSGTVNWSIDQSITQDLSDDHVQAVWSALSASKIEPYVRDRVNEMQVHFSFYNQCFKYLLCPKFEA